MAKRGRPRIYSDEERREISKQRNKEYRLKKSIKLHGTREEREARELERRKQVVARCGAFEYVGNYTGSDGTADIRCLKCGAIITRSWITIRHANVTCDNCEAIKRDEQKRKREVEKQIKEEQAILKRENGFDQLAFCICDCCGKLFIPWRKGLRYCSDECMKRVNNSISKDRRVKKIMAQERDTITLKRLYERDNGVCYLCGDPCDWNDYIETDKAFIAGNNYPSVDHVVPLSAGGRHTWDNVRLAHRICNTFKGFNPLPMPSASQNP